MQNSNKINILLKEKFEDIHSKKTAQSMQEHFNKSLEGMKIITAKCYQVIGNYQSEQIEKVSKELFTDKIIENYFINNFPSFDFDYVVEVGFKDGVTDNISKSALEGIKDLLGNDYLEDTKVKSFQCYFFDFDKNENQKISLDELKNFASEYLYNSLIESCNILSKQDWQGDFPIKAEKEIPKIKELYQTINLNVSDDELVDISKKMTLSLNLEEMKVIQKYFLDKKEQRQKNNLPTEATDVELEVLAQTWSEHCKHKIFAANIEYRENGVVKEKISSLYKSYIKSTTYELMKDRKDLLSVFSDNAGIVSFDEENAYCLKVETHNSPSALDPYGGAMTGIVGVNRDILGTGIGAKPIFNTDIFCFAPPNYSGEIPKKLMHPKRIFRGVHKGVEEGGNQSGIPTVNGSIVFDDRFLGKPLVFCGTGGIMPKKIKGRLSHEKEIVNGDLIAMVGGRIGKDGIHGATFSSLILDDESSTSSVQIGDPITQKKMTDFLITARDQGLIRAITDNGAGGLSSSIGEMATLVGGCNLHLDKCPLKYEGLYPWQILISEAQERMSLAVDPKNKSALMELSKVFSVEVSFIGDFNDSNFFNAFYDEKIVCSLDMDFLHDGLPTLSLVADWTPQQNETSKENFLESSLKNSLDKVNHNEMLETLLSRYNVCSKEYWVRQYDHEVQGRTMLKPFGGGELDAPMDAAVVTPIYNSKEGLVISNGLLPRYSDIDTYEMAILSVDEAVRNLVATGGDPDQMVGLDNFCWPDPVESPENLDGQYKLAQLVRANQGLKEICLTYKIPMISGKDSMKNDYVSDGKKISVPPTLLFTAATKIKDINNICTTPFKEIDSFIYQIGMTQDCLAGSEFYSCHDMIGNSKKKYDLQKTFSLYKKIHAAMQDKIFSCCHDISDGGLIVAIAESCFGNMIGADINLDTLCQKGLSVNAALYGESHGRFIVEVSQDKQEKLKELFDDEEFFLIGKTSLEEEITVETTVDKNNQNILKSSIYDIKKKWKEALIF